jgi:hypothetical protein
MGGAAAVKVALLCPASSVEVECGSTTVSAFGVSAGTGATHVAGSRRLLRDCCATARARIPHRILAAASTAVLAGGCPISHACAGPAQQQQAGSIASKHAVDDPSSSSCWTLLALAGSGLCLLVRVSDWLQPCGLPCCLLLLPEASSSWLPVAWPGQWGSGIRRSSFTIELVRRASMPSA